MVTLGTCVYLRVAGCGRDLDPSAIEVLQPTVGLSLRGGGTSPGMKLPVLTLASVLSRITVSLRRLKHFDCKEKHTLLVGGGLWGVCVCVHMRMCAIVLVFLLVC